ncbi:MAG: hypothetical protein KTV68_18530 [Acidimicrobiia bacterium]|nr:hypothetical protein [Acidimicrobiia bacterium]MCY4432109.1 hypothetical protein [bacterium]
MQSAVPLSPHPAVLPPWTRTAYVVDADRLENTWRLPEADAHPLPRETRYLCAPATEPQLTVMLLAVLLQVTTGAAGGAVVVHKVLGYT